MTNEERKVLELALQFIESNADSDSERELVATIKEALTQSEQCQCPNCRVTLHASDCAVHSGPAYPAGGCDCGAQQGTAIGDIRALKHRIHELEGEVIGYKQMLDAQPEQEPVAWQLWVGADTPLNAPMGWQFYSTYDSLKNAEISARTINSYQQAPFAKIVPLYTTPPQRTWVGLTRMDLIKCGVLPFGMSYELCQAIEAKLKERNDHSI